MDAPPSHRRPTRTALRAPLPPTPVGTSRAGALDLTRAAVRHGVSAGDLRPLGRGVIVRCVDEPDLVARHQAEQRLLEEAEASSLRCDRAALSHFAAAIAFDVPTYGPLGRPCLTVPSGTALRHLAAAHLHRATIRPEDLREIAGHAVLGPARTALDIAREHGVTAAVVAIDHLLRTGMVTMPELLATLDLCAGWPGQRRARLALARADGSAESPLESVSRLRLLAAGLPEPVLQVEFCDLDGNYITRSDFYWPEFGVVGEADGQMKYDLDGQVQARQDRTQAALERTGLEVVRWGWSDLATFTETVREIERAYRRGAPPGSPRRRWGIVLPRDR